MVCAVDAQQAHCRRVAALAVETARHLGVPEPDLRLLEAAALRHHHFGPPFPSHALDKLLQDLGVPATGEPLPRNDEQPPEDVLAVLHALRHQTNGETDERAALLAEFIEVADLFVTGVEFQPYEYRRAAQILDDLTAMAREGFFRPEIPMALARLPRVSRQEMLDKIQSLPVYPVVAVEALSLAADDSASFLEIERLISKDQVLAGAVVQTANSSLFDPVQRIAGIRQAMTYIGLDRLKKVIMAAVFRPLYLSANLESLWRHSLDVARLCGSLANFAGLADSGAAFLTGLVHDVGRLLIARLPKRPAEVYARLVEKGCEPLLAEQALLGFDHADLSAECLQSWLFPEPLVEAVRRHHEPEQTDSGLASLLYLAEYWSASEEDLPSRSRLAAAFHRTGLDYRTISAYSLESDQLFDALARAA